MIDNEERNVREAPIPMTHIAPTTIVIEISQVVKFPFSRCDRPSKYSQISDINTSQKTKIGRPIQPTTRERWMPRITTAHAGNVYTMCRRTIWFGIPIPRISAARSARLQTTIRIDFVALVVSSSFVAAILGLEACACIFPPASGAILLCGKIAGQNVENRAIAQVCAISSPKGE